MLRFLEKNREVDVVGVGWLGVGKSRVIEDEIREEMREGFWVKDVVIRVRF